MVKYENYCVACERCIGIACPYNNKIPVHYCDKCGEQIDEVYDVEGEELCEYCLCEKFKKRG